MMKHCVLPIALLTFLGCQAADNSSPGSKAPEATGEVLAVVDGYEIHSGHIEAQMASMQGQARIFYSGDEVKRQMLQNMVNNQLLYAEAKRHSFENDETIQRLLDWKRREILAQAYLIKAVEEQLTEKRLKQEFEGNKALYDQPQVKASHIVVKSEAEAQKLFGQLQKGADFAELAKKHSLDPMSGQRGGDLGWFSAGRMVKEFSDTAFALKPGELSKPVKTQIGYHVIKVTAKRDSEPFDEVKPQLKAKLEKQLRDEFVANLRSNAEIDIRLKLPTSQPPVNPFEEMLRKQRLQQNKQN